MSTATTEQNWSDEDGDTGWRLQGEDDPEALGPRDADRLRIIQRLLDEGRGDLCLKIQECNQRLNLMCQNCGNPKAASTRCKLRWCPVCQPSISARRIARVSHAVGSMQWPLFVTLTMRNVQDLNLGAIRHLKKSFGKFRRWRLWDRNVKGGVTALEVTNVGAGWHPHLHSIVDCRWLAIRTPAPHWRDSPHTIADKCGQAAGELSAAWAKALGQRYGVVLAKRCDREGIKSEVLKYSVKGSDLIESVDPIAPLIDAMAGCRMITTYGSLYRLKPPPDDYKPAACKCGQCCWAPEEFVMGGIRKAISDVRKTIGLR